MADFDNINNPKHYNREGAKFSCFDEFLLLYGVEAARYACLFNIHKYRYRAAEKNGLEDLAKSDWYMNKYAELMMINNMQQVVQPPPTGQYVEEERQRDIQEAIRQSMDSRQPI